MEHLPVHLPCELKVRGPVQYLWLYDYERFDMIHNNHVSSVVHKSCLILLEYRFLHHLNGKIGNKAHVVPSICHAYLMEEIRNFITNYFDDSVDVKARDLPRNVVNIQ